MSKAKKGFQIAYLIVGAATVCEFLFIRGMFTWLMAVAATVAVGLVNVALTAKDQEWNLSLLYILCTMGLCMGYTVLGP